MTQVLCCVNHKGGVGKTTTALTLGAALAEQGHSVCLIGLDQQRNLSLFAETMSAAQPGLFFVKSTARGLAKRVETLRDKGAAFVIVDCPPRLGPEVLASLRVADLAIVPIQTNALVLQGFEEMVEVIESARDPRRENSNPKLRYKILVTKFDATDSDSREQEERLRQVFGDAVFPEVVGDHKTFNQAANRFQSVLQYASRSRGAAVYRALAREVLADAKK